MYGGLSVIRDSVPDSPAKDNLFALHDSYYKLQQQLVDDKVMRIDCNRVIPIGTEGAGIPVCQTIILQPGDPRLTELNRAGEDYKKAEDNFRLRDRSEEEVARDLIGSVMTIGGILGLAIKILPRPKANT